MCDWRCNKIRDIRNACKRPVVLKDLLEKIRKYYEIPLNIDKSSFVEGPRLVYAKFKIDNKCIGRVVFKINQKSAPICSYMFLDFLKRVSYLEETSRIDHQRKEIDVQWYVMVIIL